MTIKHADHIVGGPGSAVFVRNGRLGGRAIQLIEQPLRHGDLGGGGVNRNALLIVIGGDLLDVRDGADDRRDLLELLGGGGVGEVEDAVAILLRMRKRK